MEKLAKHIISRLAHGRTYCLVFKEQFFHLWPPVRGKKAAAERIKAIEAFARQNGWSVEFENDRLKFKMLPVATPEEIKS